MSLSVYVFAHEVTVGGYKSTPPRTDNGLPTRRVVIPDGTPAHALTGLIKKSKRRHEKFSRLHLIAHAGPGRLFLSGVSHFRYAIDEAGAWWFGALRNHFEKAFPMVVVHGCNAASNAAYNAQTGAGTYGRNQMGVGYQFALTLAKATKTIVQAGINRQLNDPGYRLEGPTITVGPRGAAAGAEFHP